MAIRNLPQIISAWVFALCVSTSAYATTSWNGPMMTFTKPDGADWTLAANQDRINNDVWLTRQNTQGLFNIAQESSYHGTSPANTEWAFGTTTNWNTLTYNTWGNTIGHYPPGMVGQDMVVHLITDDIYAGVTFLSWSVGDFGGQGGFSYERSTESIPPPPPPQPLPNTRTIDFENLPDGTAVSNQYSGVVFSNTTLLTAGIGLNELEFPPYSGNNVVVDSGGPITIDFQTSATSVGGFFTYSEPLTLTAFDAYLNPVAVIYSAFSSNLAVPGIDGASFPNEYLGLTDLTGISRITISGDPNGGSFSLDDLRYSTFPVPVPPSIYLFVIGWLVPVFGKVYSEYKIRYRG